MFPITIKTGMRFHEIARLPLGRVDGVSVSGPSSTDSVSD
jgi:hypothetical protein